MTQAACVRMVQQPPKTNYRELLEDDEHLVVFLRKMKEFDTAFCDLMSGGDDFTLRLEVRGNKGVLLHAKVQNERIDRPDGVERLVEKRRGGGRE